MDEQTLAVPGQCRAGPVPCLLVGYGLCPSLDGYCVQQGDMLTRISSDTVLLSTAFFEVSAALRCAVAPTASQWAPPPALISACSPACVHWPHVQVGT